MADEFNADRDKRWPAPDDAVSTEDNPNTPPVRKERPGKASNRE